MAVLITEKDFYRLERTVRTVERMVLQQQRRGRPVLAKNAGGEMFIAEVVSDATGGGYYNCQLQSLDATDWDTTTADQLDATDDDEQIVLNIAEIGSSVHNLDAGDLIICFNFTDDEGNVRLVGNEVFGRHTFGEW